MKTKKEVWEIPEELFHIADALDILANNMQAVAKQMCLQHGNKTIKLHGRELKGAAKIAFGWAKKIRNPPKEKPEWEQFRDSCS